MRFVLLHSPLLGPLTWRATAAALAGRGHQTQTPSWPRLSSIAEGYYPALAAAMAANVEEGDPAVLVAHSGAGALVPALAAAMRAPPARVIFVDAILPHPRRSWFDTAPAEVRERLRGGAQMGQLPPWDDWWPPGALERLVPDPQLRQALVAELEPLPLAYFEEPAPEGDAAPPAAYLKLSGAYEDEARIAGRLGWPVVRLPMNHLAMLSQPDAVATAIEGLAAAGAPA
ncbi:alpha/beta hydrolase [Phenylobacterium hankyongense]|uniref:Alpha/beta hydrolase n=1 Tax=Phenylobacterium hankyongense TaxID=1813876 RepID=A0A328B1P9_9CAUL|nr:alpha/beta fold hydrolase [Phenylobacterium hankyongense]RAK61113.1 alpha/beta hydrolase [Phenylobacterium hankyongense]